MTQQGPCIKSNIIKIMGLIVLLSACSLKHDNQIAIESVETVDGVKTLNTNYYSVDDMDTDYNRYFMKVIKESLENNLEVTVHNDNTVEPIKITDIEGNDLLLGMNNNGDKTDLKVNDVVSIALYDNGEYIRGYSTSVNISNQDKDSETPLWHIPFYILKFTLGLGIAIATLFL